MMHKTHAHASHAPTAPLEEDAAGGHAVFQRPNTAIRTDVQTIVTDVQISRHRETKTGGLELPHAPGAPFAATPCHQTPAHLPGNAPSRAPEIRGYRCATEKPLNVFERVFDAIPSIEGACYPCKEPARD